MTFGQGLRTTQDMLDEADKLAQVIRTHEGPLAVDERFAGLLDELAAEVKLWRGRYVTMRRHRDQALVDLRQYEDKRTGGPAAGAA